MGRESLSRALDSVLNQTSNPFEVVIVGSEIPSDCFMPPDIFVLSVLSDAHLNASSARNKGVDACTGD